MQVAVIYAGTSGGLDDVDANRVPEFEKAYTAHLRANHADLLASVKTEKWGDEIAKKFDDVCAAFVKEFNA